jgi:hypothetical protein
MSLQPPLPRPSLEHFRRLEQLEASGVHIRWLQEQTDSARVGERFFHILRAELHFLPHLDGRVIFTAWDWDDVKSALDVRAGCFKSGALEGHCVYGGIWLLNCE